MARRRAESFENNLRKRPEDIKMLNDIFFDSLKRGVLRFLSPEEIENWTGLVHYVPVNRVYKDSESTPVRLVFDSGNTSAENVPNPLSKISSPVKPP